MTVINNAGTPSEGSGSNNSLALILILVVVVVLFLVFFRGGLGFGGNSGGGNPQINVPGKVDVNVKGQQ